MQEGTETSYAQMRDALIPHIQWLASLDARSFISTPGRGRRYVEWIDHLLTCLDEHEAKLKELLEEASQKKTELEVKETELETKEKRLNAEITRVAREYSRIQADREMLAIYDQEVEQQKQDRKELNADMKLLDQKWHDSIEKIVAYKAQEESKLHEERKVFLEQHTSIQDTQRATIDEMSQLKNKITQLLNSFKSQRPPILSEEHAKENASVDVNRLSRPNRNLWECLPNNTRLNLPSVQHPWQASCDALISKLQLFRPVMDISCQHITIDRVLEQFTVACLNKTSLIFLEQFIDDAPREVWHCFHHVCKHGYWNSGSKILASNKCFMHQDGCLQIKRPLLSFGITNVICKLK